MEFVRPSFSGPSFSVLTSPGPPPFSIGFLVGVANGVGPNENGKVRTAGITLFLEISSWFDGVKEWD